MSYVFQPYPMRMTSPDGKRIRILSKEEHDKLLEEWGHAPKTDPVLEDLEPPVVDAGSFDHDGDGRPGGSLPYEERMAEPSQADLAAKANELGIKVDKRWGSKRLEAEIKAASK